MASPKKNLIAARKTTGYKQEFIARRANITTRHYRALESGKSEGSLAVWKKLSELFGKTLDILTEE